MSAMGGKLPLADPLVSQFSDPDAGQWQPQNKQQNVPPPRHVESEHNNSHHRWLNDYAEALA